jgi:hypothetical protein
LPDWADADGDCQNTRHEVLILEADGPLIFGAGACTVATGLWTDPYTAGNFTLASDLDIDHTVPLADAHRSGGWQWSTAMKRAFANDLAHPETLIAVDDATNSAKGDKTPDQWLPPNSGYRCTYAIEWVSVKSSWTLTVTTTERATLASLLKSC